MVLSSFNISLVSDVHGKFYILCFVRSYSLRAPQVTIEFFVVFISSFQLTCILL